MGIYVFCYCIWGLAYGLALKKFELSSHTFEIIEPLRRNKRAFENEEQSGQGLKYAFLCNLWDWSRLFLIFGPSSVVDFVNWVGSFWGGHSFLLVPFLSFALLSVCCILLAYFRGLFWRFFVYNTLWFAHQKKNNNNWALEAWLKW